MVFAGDPHFPGTRQYAGLKDGSRDPEDICHNIGWAVSKDMQN